VRKKRVNDIQCEYHYNVKGMLFTTGEEIISTPDKSSEKVKKSAQSMMDRYFKLQVTFKLHMEFLELQHQKNVFQIVKKDLKEKIKEIVRYDHFS